MDAWLSFVVLGLVCGVFSAAFGVGSGIILVPALVLLFHFPQKSAQGICLAVIVPMALAGAFQYWRNPQIEVDLTVAAWLAVGAVAGALIGAAVAGALSGPMLRRLFAVVLMIAAVRMMIASPERATVADGPGPAGAVETHIPDNEQDRGGP